MVLGVGFASGVPAGDEEQDGVFMGELGRFVDDKLVGPGDGLPYLRGEGQAIIFPTLVVWLEVCFQWKAPSDLFT